MSVFTHAGPDGAKNAAAYVAATFEILGDRDPLEVLEELSAVLAEATSGLDLEQLQRPEAPGKWSIVELLRHLADNEVIWAYRVRVVVAEDEPTIPAYDQDLWFSRLGYGQSDFEESLTLIRVVRSSTCRLLRSLTPEQWRRTGHHVERGRQDLDQIVRLQAGHDLVHRRQLERISRSLGA